MRLASRLALLGVPSLRYDLSGLGDSASSVSTRSLTDQWVMDTQEAMDLMQLFTGAKRFMMVGLCSGADIAYLTALRDERLRAAVLWDLVCYPTTRARANGAVAKWLYRVRNLISGVETRQARASTERAEGALKASAPKAETGFYGRTEMPDKARFAGDIEALVQRGVDLLFAYSGSAPERFNYQRQFFDMFRGYAFPAKVAYSYLSECDHLFNQQSGQEEMESAVLNWFLGRNRGTQA